MRFSWSSLRVRRRRRGGDSSSSRPRPPVHAFRSCRRPTSARHITFVQHGSKISSRILNTTWQPGKILSFAKKSMPVISLHHTHDSAIPRRKHAKFTDPHGHAPTFRTTCLGRPTIRPLPQGSLWKRRVDERKKVEKFADG